MKTLGAIVTPIGIVIAVWCLAVVITSASSHLGESAHVKEQSASERLMEDQAAFAVLKVQQYLDAQR
jgi:hypothetical protein